MSQNTIVLSHIISPWYESSYSSDDPYGEPLLYAHEGLYNESNLAYEEVGAGGFLSGSWYSGYRLADQLYHTAELSNNGGSNWIDECKSYFASCWEEDMVPRGYGSREYEDYKGSLAKAVTNEVGDQDVSYSSFTDAWPGYHFGLVDGIKDNYSIAGRANQPPENNNDPWDYADSGKASLVSRLTSTVQMRNVCQTYYLLTAFSN